MVDKPLLNKKILVTRAKGQASEISSELTKRGACVIEFPTIQICPPTSYESLDAVIKDIGQYEWLFLTSVNGVEAFLDRLGKAGKSISDLSHLKIGAIGSATGTKLEKSGLKVDFLPEEFRAEGIVKSFKEKGIKNAKVLFPRAKVAREILVDELKKFGCHVDVVEAYQTVVPKMSRENLKKVFVHKKPDWITFLSSSSVENFVKILGQSNLKQYISGVKVACIGPVTKDTAEGLSLKVDVMPKKSTVSDLVNAITSYISPAPR